MHMEDSASGHCTSWLGGVQGAKMEEIDPRKLIWAGHIKESESKSYLSLLATISSVNMPS